MKSLVENPAKLSKFHEPNDPTTYIDFPQEQLKLNENVVYRLSFQRLECLDSSSLDSSDARHHQFEKWFNTQPHSSSQNGNLVIRLSEGFRVFPLIDGSARTSSTLPLNAEIVKNLKVNLLYLIIVYYKNSILSMYIDRPFDINEVSLHVV